MLFHESQQASMRFGFNQSARCRQSLDSGKIKVWLVIGSCRSTSWSSAQQVSYWERGHNRISVQMILDLCRKIDEDPVYMAFGIIFTSIDHAKTKECNSADIFRSKRGRKRTLGLPKDD
jgi:hypothetical protein